MIPPVSKLVLGTSTLGLNGSRQDAFRLLDTFVDLGGTTIDTAGVYNDWVPGEVGRSEDIIGEWLGGRSRPPGFLICTKGAHPPLSDMARSRLDAESITKDVEASLRRLRVERLDLFYLHRDDPARPVELILEPLRRLLDAGKIAAVGVSNWLPERLAAARRAAIVSIASNQVLGNALSRHMSPPADPTIVRLDEATLHDAETTGSSLFLYSSQCGGHLTKRLSDAAAGPAEYRSPAAAQAGDRIIRLAAGIGVDPTNLVVSFLLGFSPNIFPIVGARSPLQLRQSMRAFDHRLTPSEAAEVAKISGFAEWR